MEAEFLTISWMTFDNFSLGSGDNVMGMVNSLWHFIDCTVSQLIKDSGNNHGVHPSYCVND